jgi:hypothetical protein
MSRAIYICGGQRGTAAAREDKCASPLHDWPLPSGYVDAAEEAAWRLANRWSNTRCAVCDLYGWGPGRLTELHVRRPAAGTSPTPAETGETP